MSDSEHRNKQLLETFYGAFLKFDGETMADCYHPDATFSDEVFPDLKAGMPGNMWRMLCEKLQNSPSKLSYSNVWANETEGGCDWQAEYIFSATGNKVQNIVSSHFKFLDGKIIEQRDRFNFWRWSRMALGLPGYLLGWSGFLRGKVQLQAKKGLHQFSESTPTKQDSE